MQNLQTKYPGLPNYLYSMISKIINDKTGRLYLHTERLHEVDDLSSIERSSDLVSEVIEKLLTPRIDESDRSSIMKKVREKTPTDIKAYIPPAEAIRIFNISHKRLRAHEEYDHLSPLVINGEDGFEWRQVQPLFTSDSDIKGSTPSRYTSLMFEGVAKKKRNELLRILDQILEQYRDLTRRYKRKKEEYEKLDGKYRSLAFWGYNSTHEPDDLTYKKADEVIEKRVCWSKSPIELQMYKQQRTYNMLFITEKQICEIGGYDPGALQTWCREFKLPQIVEEDCRLYPWDAVEMLLEEELPSNH